MKSILVACLLFNLLLICPAVIHAEGGCPAGMIPYSGNDINSCGPLPANYYGKQQQGQQAPQPSPPRWATRWGAIAIYEPDGSVGTVSDMQDADSAEQAALASCESKHGSKCKVKLSYRNQCAALIVSDKGYNVTPGLTVIEATQKGMKICNDSGDPNCGVYYTACSLPVRIQ